VINIIDDTDAPSCENEEEVITDVILSFIPMDGGDTLVARAQDPDGEGVLGLEVIENIELEQNTTYELQIELLNTVADEVVTEEIMEEDDEHQFFFAWTDGLFADPMGNGNIDNRDDAVNYNDFDGNNNPLGLSTTWTTSSELLQGTFTVLLKHQPDVKTDMSTSDDGETDFRLEFGFNTVVTSTQEVVQNATEFKIAPNPADQFINWSLDQVQAQDLQLEIYDQLGRLMKVYNQPDNRINVSEFNRGTYVILARTDRKVWVKRFVKN
ncbi:MAG: T9SS type A sorting domain-containing protein, partial [Bacteroidota bacterium]